LHNTQNTAADAADQAHTPYPPRRGINTDTKTNKFVKTTYRNTYNKIEKSLLLPTPKAAAATNPPTNPTKTPTEG
jgi:hypothetical protein